MAWEAGMAEQGAVDGLELADAISLLREELLKARAHGAGTNIQLPVESMTVQLAVRATTGGEGRVGFRVPFAEAGAGVSREHGAEQTVTVVFGQPVDRAGNPVKVAAGGDEMEG
jgi:hypothetical protein